MVIGALGGKYVRKYAMACGSPVSALMKKSGKIVRIIITLENELASFAVGETAPIATQNAVNKKYDAMSKTAYCAILNASNCNAMSNGSAP